MTLASRAQAWARSRTAWTTAGLALALTALAAWASVGRSRAAGFVGERSAARGATAKAMVAESTLHVPRAMTPIVVNAETQGKSVWDGEVGNTGNLKDRAGLGMVPYTQAKVRWNHANLYFMLYAGDLDLEGTVRNPDGALDHDDSFRLELGIGKRVYVVAVSVLGTLYDAVCDGQRCDSSWQSKAMIAVDRDGTLNTIGDNDEEWVVEMAIPFSSLGIAGAAAGTRIPFSVRRCEVGYDGVHACGSWGAGDPRGDLLLDP